MAHFVQQEGAEDHHQVARKMNQRREKLASKNQKVSADDFSDLATPAKSISEVEIKKQGAAKNNGGNILTEKSFDTTEISKTMPVGVTITDVSQEEETPMPVRKKMITCTSKIVDKS